MSFSSPALDGSPRSSSLDYPLANAAAAPEVGTASRQEPSSRVWTNRSGSAARDGLDSRLEEHKFVGWNKLTGQMAARCIGKPAARAQAFFSAANDASNSWKSRIWNGIRGVGYSALTVLGSLATLTVGIVVAAPVIIGLTVGFGLIGGAIGSCVGPAGSIVGLIVGGSAGAALGLYTVLRDMGAGAQEGYRFYKVQASQPDHTYLAIVSPAPTTPTE